jgi:acyl carrier protein
MDHSHHESESRSMTISGVDTIQRVRDIMMDVFELDELPITEATTADDIEQWNSLSHIRLIVAIERAFQIRFTNAEIESLKDVGDLIRRIDAKRSK